MTSQQGQLVAQALRQSAALQQIAHEARQSADTYGCANCNAYAEIAAAALRVKELEDE